jgi:hypothetical protein
MSEKEKDAVIKELLKMVKAQKLLLVAYRLGGGRPGKAIDQVAASRLALAKYEIKV